MGLLDIFKPKKREENDDHIVDSLVSMTSSDAGLYVGAGALKNSDIFSAIRKISGDIAGNSTTLGTELFVAHIPVGTGKNGFFSVPTGTFGCITPKFDTRNVILRLTELSIDVFHRPFLLERLVAF